MTDTGRQAWRDLMRATAEINARLNRRLQQACGVSLPDFEVLDAVARAPERLIRVYELADALGWEQSRLSHQLGRMQRRALIDRSQCSEDGRGTFIALTPAGRGALRRAASVYDREVAEAVLDGLTAGQVIALGELTSALAT